MTDFHCQSEHVEALTQLKDAKKAELQAETEEAF
jgi:hypothetical protein